MKKIEKPDWNTMGTYIMRSHRLELDKWFSKHIEPINKMLDEAVEVYECKDEPEHSSGNWYQYPKDCLKINKALLINIQPVKKESAEDVLKLFIENYRVANGEQGFGEIPLKNLEKVFFRALKVLNEK